MAQALEKMGPAAMFFDRGLSIAFARAFGVHRSTAWRDLQVILGPGRNYHFTCGDKELFTITRAYGGGPVLSVTDPEGQEIRGDQRRAVLRRLPRYFGR